MAGRLRKLYAVVAMILLLLLTMAILIAAIRSAPGERIGPDARAARNQPDPEPCYCSQSQIGSTPNAPAVRSRTREAQAPVR